jgi:hypothetical protein
MAFCGVKPDCAACIKNSVTMFVDEMYKMWSLRESSTPLLYIGCSMPKG